MKYPKALKKGDYIGVTAPSEGITKKVNYLRLDNAKSNLEKEGFQYLETSNVRTNEKGRSSSGKERAQQFIELWKNPQVSAIISAGGGCFLSEMLDYLDFEKLAKLEPKWFQGYSNNTEITMLLTTLCDTACIYGPTIKDYGMRNWHQVLKDSILIMQGNEIKQQSYKKCETREWKERIDPYEEYDLTENTKWKNLNNEEKIHFKGRSIGGCFDEVTILIGTKYDKIKEYIEKYKQDGIVWFLEVFEMSTSTIYLHLWQMKNAGYFENCTGIIFGRNLMVREDENMIFEEAIKCAIGDLKIPIIYDADIRTCSATNANSFWSSIRNYIRKRKRNNK